MADALAGMSRGDMKETMLEMDKRMADVEFTESLILALCESLSGDMTVVEREIFVGAVSGAINAKEPSK